MIEIALARACLGLPPSALAGLPAQGVAHPEPRFFL